MRLNLSDTDKWFFYSIPPYVIISIASIIYMWSDIQSITLAWVVWLSIGVIRFRLWKNL